MEKTIENKVVVVTGGASGIGLNIVENFIRHGANIAIIVDINKSLGDKAVKDIKQRYGKDKAIFYKCDVTLDLEKIFDHISTKYKNIDVLVNSAGIADEDSIERTININVISLMKWSMKFYDYMRTDSNRNGGTIINISSIYGIRIAPFLPSYHSSKFAVVGFTKSLGHEFNFKRTGVRVVAICPGFTYTSLTEEIRTRNDEVNEEFIKETKLNDWQEVDSVGKGVKEVFETADSGTVWVIEGSRPPIMVS